MHAAQGIVGFFRRATVPQHRSSTQAKIRSSGSSLSLSHLPYCNSSASNHAHSARRLTRMVCACNTDGAKKSHARKSSEHSAGVSVSTSRTPSIKRRPSRIRVRAAGFGPNNRAPPGHSGRANRPSLSGPRGASLPLFLSLPSASGSFHRHPLHACLTLVRKMSQSTLASEGPVRNSCCGKEYSRAPKEKRPHGVKHQSRKKDLGFAHHTLMSQWPPAEL